MTVKLISLPELNQRAYTILSRELGVVDTMRFFGQLGLGTGNYTEARQQWFAELTMQEYRDAVARARLEAERTDKNRE